jgi:hypothetical protein
MGKSTIDIYLEMTGEAYDDLLSGIEHYGLAFVLYLADRCINEHKKIKWETAITLGQKIISYTLISLPGRGDA